MNDDKQVMNIFAQAYLLLAKASKLKPSKEGFLQVLEMLGEEGIQLCAEVADLGPEVVAQTMVEILLKKSALKAENGAKLQHLMLLKDMCPEGYLKQGGRCKPCEARSEGGNINTTNKNWKEQYKKTTLNKEKSDTTKTKQQLDLLKPINKKNFKNFQDLQKKQKEILIAKNLGGDYLAYNVNEARKLHQALLNRLLEAAKTRTEGVQIGNKIYGTREFPVLLPEVVVREKVRPEHTRIISSYTLSPGYFKQSDYLHYPNGLYFGRNIDITPTGRDTVYSNWSYPYNPVYDNVKPLIGSKFDKIMKSATKSKTKKGVVKSIPFFKLSSE